MARVLIAGDETEGMEREMQGAGGSACLQRILAVLGLHKRVKKGLGGSGHADDTKLLVELRVKRTQN